MARSAWLTLIGGPTVVLEVGGLRLLTDPTFSPRGPQGSGGSLLTKLRGPAVPAERIGRIDAVLLSRISTRTTSMRAVGGCWRAFPWSCPRRLPPSVCRARL
ncbi:hypothetical protein [Microbacterium sp. zg.B185]|uniref:hypothetical protein n=1 Tax=Microbacterium sp. zg.B185 TaxID=2969410 RepID=UPI00214C7A31|nr:hypothetical protein [Microbacterium sp. zg.B185]MCR2811008.1 hypothetical protein [Microbacterium sp. zg.B185]